MGEFSKLKSVVNPSEECCKLEDAFCNFKAAFG